MTPISVVMPCYNTGKYLTEAVESVLQQSRAAAEIIIVDDGSTDEETRQLLDSYKRKGITVYRTPNRGAPSARNYGIRRAKTPYILCLDSDDVLLPAFLAETAQRLDAMKKVGVAATGVEFFGARNGQWRPPEYSPIRMLWQNCLPSASLFRKRCWEEVGGYKNLKACQDWEFWISVTVKHGWRWVVAPEILYKYRQRSGSISEYRETNRSELVQQLVKLHKSAYNSHLVELLIDSHTRCQAAVDSANQYSQKYRANKQTIDEISQKYCASVQTIDEISQKYRASTQVIDEIRKLLNGSQLQSSNANNNSALVPSSNNGKSQHVLKAQPAAKLVQVINSPSTPSSSNGKSQHVLKEQPVAKPVQVINTLPVPSSNNGKSSIVVKKQPEMEQHTFSVVICTYKRDKFLGQAIESVFAQNYPKDKYEIIVINNDSPDNTEEVIRQHAGRSPVAFSSYVEKRNGLSYARNLGVEKSRHEYVAFLDDDATACQDWLAAFNAVINEHHALVVGGRVEKAFEPGFTPPDWFNSQYIKGFFGINYRDRGRKEKVFRIRHPLYIGGGNCAYARRLFDHFSGFDPCLGRDGKTLLAGEETYLNWVLDRNDVPIYYSDEAYINHFIESSRLTKAHLRRKAWWSGVTNATISPILSGYDATWEKCKNSWKEIWDKTREILRDRKSPENFSRMCRIIYNLSFLRKFYPRYFVHKLKREREIIPPFIWSAEHRIAEALRWPEGEDKYRELYFLHSSCGEDEKARQALSHLAGYSGLENLEQVARQLKPASLLFHRQHYAELKQRVRQIANSELPRQAKVLVVSKGDPELVQLEGQQGWHFPQTGNNVYAGHYPADSASAIAHLEELRTRGADFLLFPQPAFWWLDHYADFKSHLESRYHLIVQQEGACMIFDLRNSANRSADFQSANIKVLHEPTSPQN